MEIRRATPSDLELLVQIELDDEGVTPYRDVRAPDEVARVRELMRGFITDGSARVATAGAAAIGAILWRIRALASVEQWTVFRELDPALFPPDGRFVEIFQLWVAPSHRRRGVATALKYAVEAAARETAVGLIYTHTEVHHVGVLELNAKLGYREVRRGPIWDDVVRVSLVKEVPAQP